MVSNRVSFVNSKNCVLNHYGLCIVIIMIFAFFIRICLLGDGGYSPDSVEYYTAAINIVNGNGYSKCTEAPFYPFYYREPLTSYTMALVIWLVNTITKVDFIDYPNSMIVSEMQPYHHCFIYSIRLFSVVLQIAAIFLFYKTVRRKSSDMFAIVFLLICALYLPLILNLSLVLREPYVFFLLSIISYLWCNYLDNKSFPSVAFMALTNGLLCLFLQTYWVLAVFVLSFMLWSLRKDINLFFLHGLIYLFFFSLPIVPHLYRVYQYYPDIRIVKTLGTALTFECVSGFDAYRAFGVSPWSIKDGDLPDGMETHAELFDSHNAANLFKYSFDGTFQQEAERLNSANTPTRVLKYKLENIMLSFRNTVFMVGITYDYGIFYGRFSVKDVAKFLLVLPYLLFGILGLIGLWPFMKRYWIFVPVFFYHSMLFFIYGNEERRQVMLIPYLICIVMVFIWRIMTRKRQCSQR